MKCIKNSKKGIIRRVTDSEAQKAVASGEYVFIPKKEWKEKARGNK